MQQQQPLISSLFSSSSRRSRSLRFLAFFSFLPSSMETLNPALSSPTDASSAASPDLEERIPINSSVPDASGEGESEKESGFERAEFGQEALAGTVQAYDRHVFLRYKSPEFWLPNVEAAESDGLPRILAAAIKARKNDMKNLTRLTICGAEDNTDTSDGEVLIFPERIGYRGLTDVDVDNFVESVLVKNTEWFPGAVEPLTGSYVFVCAHGSRDKRCGVCGPILIDRFKEEILARGLEDQVFVSPCSHIGGHKYAGNVIIFGQSKTGEVSGHWYGYVGPDDVPALLEQHIGKGEIIDHLWRGQMGLSKEEQKEAQKTRRRANTGPEVERASGCCQGNGNPTCCQNAATAPKSNPDHTDISKANKPATTGDGGKTSGASKFFSMPAWLKEPELETYAVVAVVAAIVSVGGAYCYYRRQN